VINPLKLEGLEEEDSEDLTDEEISQAKEVGSAEEVASAIATHLHEKASRLIKHELRRRKPHLYWRVGLEMPDGSEEVLVFQVDWLQKLAKGAR